MNKLSFGTDVYSALIFDFTDSLVDDIDGTHTDGRGTIEVAQPYVVGQYALQLALCVQEC